jgi:2-polyprenyl-3-methyl-5-hydroxy-6-metoxy-1,4-benzoquinol methylase
VTTAGKPKQTSYEYGESYQKMMLGFYEKAKIVDENNTEYLRVVKADELVTRYAEPRFEGRDRKSITLVDVGCSVGLLAIEFAKRGFKTYGVDFDESALAIARELNEKEGTDATFLKMDVSDWHLDVPIDIALAFDIFEHLHDDELGALLVGVRRRLSPRGCVVFHTLPLQYDYLFWRGRKGIIKFPILLRPFLFLSPSAFTRVVRIYAQALDLLRLMVGSETQKVRIRFDGHCNPLTQERMRDIFTRAGYDLVAFDSGFLGEVQLDRKHRKWFHKHPVTHRSLFGVAVLRQNA